MAAKHKDDGAQSDPTVNYNTYALGREGYITLDLITQQSQVPKDKGAVLALLNNIDYVEGKRYADFNSSTDKVAEYGLAALVAGVAAKKLGLFGHRRLPAEVRQGRPHRRCRAGRRHLVAPAPQEGGSRRPGPAVIARR